MPHKKRKVRKKRGSRTHGYGRVGQHRGGGHGKAGFHKHKWTYTVKYDPNRFGKHGFKPFGRKEVNIINVGELDEQIDSLLESKHAEKNKGRNKCSSKRSWLRQTACKRSSHSPAYRARRRLL